MSKTVTELSQELGLSPQYLNRVLNRNQLGNKIGNKKLVSDSDEKCLISILKGGKEETSETKSETESETSFRYVREQLEIKGKEIERLHRLLDQSQQLLLNEQKKNQLLLEGKSEDYSDKGVHQKLIESIQGSLYWNRQEVSRLNDKLENSVSKKWFYGIILVSVILLVLLLVLGWLYFFRG